MQKQLKPAAILVAGLIWLTGCPQSQPEPVRMPSELAAGSQALADNQPNAALADADAYLRSNPHGRSSAGAHYISGRAYEMKLATDRSEQRSLLVSARTEYELALHELSVAQIADPGLEAEVRTQLSGVAFFQDDFPTAIEQSQVAYNMYDAPSVKRALLYRVASSQARLGNFSAADQTYNQIIQRFPNTGEAAAAAAEQGKHRFYVRLATYPPGAPGGENAVAAMSVPGGALENITTSGATDATGQRVLDAGPFPTYPAARLVKEKVLATFPSAVVVP